MHCKSITHVAAAAQNSPVVCRGFGCAVQVLTLRLQRKCKKLVVWLNDMLPKNWKGDDILWKVKQMLLQIA